MKDVLPIPIFADQLISQRAKYLAIYVYSYLSESFNVASVKSPVELLLTISQREHLNSETESEAVMTY